MKILDRYILKFFFIQMILWYVCLVGLYLILDFFQVMDSFPQLQEERSPLEVFLIHYFFVCLSFIDIVLPLLIVMVAIRTLVYLQSRHEILILTSMGISELRIVAPILVGAVLLSVGACYLRECYLPANKQHIVRTFEEEASPSKGIAVKQIEDKKTKLKIGGERYFSATKEISKPVILLHGPHFGSSVYDIKAERAIYTPPSNSHPGGFLLEKVSQPNGFANGRSIQLLSKQPSVTRLPVVLTHADYPDWIPAGCCFAVTGINPEMFESGQNWISLASTAEIIAETANASCPISRDQLAIRIHTRILRPLSDLFPMLICLPLVFLSKNKKIYQILGGGALCAAFFIGFQYTCVYMGAQLNMPILGAWFPVILFAPIVCNLFADLSR